MQLKDKLFNSVAIIEVPTGLALLILPALVVWILFGIREASPEILIVSRIAGVAILSIGAACWIARNDGENPSHYGLLWEIFIFNAGAGIVLGWAGLSTQFIGVLLWPVAAIHVLMAIWCAGKLKSL